jgi:hypothetical protein
MLVRLYRYITGNKLLCLIMSNVLVLQVLDV